ncbi:NAD-dependent epimerase/dehydratase family protein [Bacillus sp. JJ1533]|uniref:NAD-dependent epimerase/dehydratase family protein n=1 Tax=Bacillus sp. JJ1533 TaxID=3122959 RepID=UPI002FFF2101
MKILVTGAAGFIGSHLCERLLKIENTDIIGIDSFIGPTPAFLKGKNIENLLDNPRFTLINKDILSTDLTNLFKDIDIVYHLAGMPGVRSSWGNDFDLYVTNNILVTQKLLEAAKNHKSIKKFIFASTSSVYGEKNGRVSENMSLTPLSPYGITKLTGEHLCKVYEKNFGIPIIILRYFTVYGPRQRSDMAFHRFIKQILTDEPITIYGDGSQSRDFTYIDDCIDGTVALLDNDTVLGQTINIGGKERSSIIDIITQIEKLMKKKATLHFLPKVSGEPMHTWADISLAEKLLGYSPKVTLKQGLEKELNLFRSIYGEKKG